MQPSENTTEAPTTTGADAGEPGWRILLKVSLFVGIPAVSLYALRVLLFE